MYRNIYTHINDSLDDRSSDIITHIASRNRSYVILTNRILELQDNIMKLLPEGAQETFLTYEELRVERDCIKNLMLYKQGVMDGIKIKNLVSGNFEKKYL